MKIRFFLLLLFLPVLAFSQEPPKSRSLPINEAYIDETILMIDKLKLRENRIRFNSSLAKSIYPYDPAKAKAIISKALFDLEGDWSDYAEEKKKCEIFQEGSTYYAEEEEDDPELEDDDTESSGCARFRNPYSSNLEPSPNYYSFWRAGVKLEEEALELLNAAVEIDPEFALKEATEFRKRTKVFSEADVQEERTTFMKALILGLAKASPAKLAQAERLVADESDLSQIVSLLAELQVKHKDIADRLESMYLENLENPEKRLDAIEYIEGNSDESGIELLLKAFSEEGLRKLVPLMATEALDETSEIEEISPDFLELVKKYASQFSESIKTRQADLNRENSPFDIGNEDGLKTNQSDQAALELEARAKALKEKIDEAAREIKQDERDRSNQPWNTDNLNIDETDFLNLSRENQNAKLMEATDFSSRLSLYEIGKLPKSELENFEIEADKRFDANFLSSRAIGDLNSYAVGMARQGKNAKAKALLDRHFAKLDKSNRTLEKTESLVDFAYGYSFVNPEISFSIFEQLVGDSNKILAGFINTVSYVGFIGSENLGEISIGDAMQLPVLKERVGNIDVAITNLSKANPKRLLELPNRSEFPEANVFGRTRIIAKILKQAAIETDAHGK